MTERQVIAEVKRLRGALLLQHWQIEVDCKDVAVLSDDGCVAHIDWDSSYWQATITVAMRRDDALVREAVLHEMLHLAVHELVDVAQGVIKALGQQAQETAVERLFDANEHTVRRLEYALRIGYRELREGKY